jgi:hypothetical protein
MSQNLGYGVALQDILTGEIINHTDRIIPGTFRINRTGISYAVYMNAYEAARYTADIRVYKIIATRLGDDRVFRLITPKVQSDRVIFNGAPLTSALDDGDLNFFFSTRDITRWKAATEDDTSGVTPAKYQTSEPGSNGRPYAGLIEGLSYRNGLDGYGWFFETNKLHTAGITYVAFEFQQSLPAGWQVQILRLSRGRPWGYVGSAWAATPTAPGILVALAVPVTACDIVLIWIVNQSGATYVPPANTTGQYYMAIYNIRTMGYSGGNTATTTTGATVPTTNGAIPVVSTAGMVVGADAYIDSAAAASALTNSERVKILAIDSATQFRATTSKAHALGVTVRTQRVTERGVADRLFNTVLNANAGWVINGAAGLIQTTGRDLEESEWYKTKPSAIMTELAKRDSFAWGVTPAGYLYFYPEGTYARTWLIDADKLDINRPIEGQSGQFRNSVRAEYTDASGAQQLTAFANNEASIKGSGLTRSTTIVVDTTDQATAESIRDLALADGSNRPIEAAVSADCLMNSAGIITAADSPEPGDYLIIRNVSAVWDDADISIIPIRDVELDPETGRPTIIPSAPIQTLDRYLARIK